MCGSGLRDICGGGTFEDGRLMRGSFEDCVVVGNLLGVLVLSCVKACVCVCMCSLSSN